MRRDKVNENKNVYRLGRHFRMVWALFGSFWVILVVIFMVFLSFGGCLDHPGASLGTKSGSWAPFGRQTRIRVILRVPGGRHFVAKGGPREPQRRR